ncbi:MAG: DUF2935 domain-containing protein [Bacilli bacterium]|nr:DUF2935 domain-containing protein [Bacilli bacterium]
MISDAEYIEQSVPRSMYFFRTIREYCTTIALSFYENDSEYIQRANQIKEECERVGRAGISGVSGGISKEAFDSEIFLTPYTLPLEELTEKLFGIKIATDITKREVDLRPSRVLDASSARIAELTRIDKNARRILAEFITFVQDILVKQRSNLLFSSCYPILFEFMIQQAKLYDTELDRLLARQALDPIYVVNHQFLFNVSMHHIATFLRGYIDPAHTEQTAELDQFIRDFSDLILQYQKAAANPYIQETLMHKSIAILNRFNTLVESLIKDLLKTKIYFIVEPAFLDNMYTDIHYFQYVLMQNEKEGPKM